MKNHELRQLDIRDLEASGTQPLEDLVRIILRSGLPHPANVLRPVAGEHILARVGIVHVDPVDAAALYGLGEGLDVRTPGLHLGVREVEQLCRPDLDRHLEEDPVARVSLEAQHVAASLDGGLGEKRRQRHEDALRGEVAVGHSSLEILDQSVVDLRGLSHDPLVVLEVHREPDGAKR